MPRIQHKRGTSANLASVNPTPLAGELVWDSTENAIKIGDGATAWTSLAYVTATPRSHVHDGGDITTGTVAYARLPVGSTSSTVCAGDDARLTDARTPTAHKSTHATGGSDALTPGDIGAAPAASPTFTGNATFDASSGVPVTITNTGTGNSFVVNDAAGDTTPFVVDAAGIVGIQNSNPQSVTFQGLLLGAGTGNIGLTLLCSTSATGTIAFGDGTTGNESYRGYVQYLHANDAMQFGTSAATRLFISSSGNVGIGTNSPASRLDVNGQITVSAGSAAAPAIVASGDSNAGLLFPAADTVAISTAGVERVRVKPAGSLRTVPLSTDPTSGNEAGDIQYNSLLNKLRVHDGTRWKSIDGEAWDISSAEYVHSTSVASEITDPFSVYFRANGKQMYVLGNAGLAEYALSVPWNVATATHTQHIGTAINNSRGLAFNNDGSLMYILDLNAVIATFSLSEPWNTATATTNGQTFTAGSEGALPTGLAISPNGEQMYIVSYNNRTVVQYTLSTPFDVSTASFTRSLNVAPQDTLLTGMFFRDDGRRMYVLGFSGDQVYEYVLSAPWDISTATHSQALNVASQDTEPRDVFFRPDGGAMFVAGRGADAVAQYTLKPLATITPDSIGAAPAASPTFTGVITVPAGTVGAPSVTISGDDNTGLAQLGGADTFSIVVGGSERLRVDGTATHLYGSTRSGLRFNSAYTVGGTDIGVLSFFNNSSTLIGRMDCSSTAADETSTGVFRFQTRNSAGSSVNSLFVYPTGIAVQGGSASEPALRFLTDLNTGMAQLGGADTCSIVTAGSERLRAKSNGVIRYVPLTADPASGEAGDIYYNSTLQKLRVYNGSRWVSLHGAAWDISTASLSGSFSVAAQEEDPTDIAFKPDGLRMYIAGFDNNIYEYDLSVAWDVTTATYSQSFSVATQETQNRGVTFSADGSKMFTIGISGDDVNEYSLSTPWDVSTATYTTNFSVGDKEGTPTSVKFSVDGTKMYVLGLTTDHVYQYALATAFDVSTATYSQSFSVLSQESTPWSVWFRPDGLRMYVMGYNGGDVNQYVLSTAWDITTATYAQVFSVAAEENDPRGLAFSADGTRMYITGRTNDKVHQYSLL